MPTSCRRFCTMFFVPLRGDSPSQSRFARQRLAAARSRRGFFLPPACHSLPRRRFAALRGSQGPLSLLRRQLPRRGSQVLRGRHAYMRALRTRNYGVGQAYMLAVNPICPPQQAASRLLCRKTSSASAAAALGAEAMQFSHAGYRRMNGRTSAAFSFGHPKPYHFAATKRKRGLEDALPSPRSGRSVMHISYI